MLWCLRFISTDMLLTYCIFFKQCAYKIMFFIYLLSLDPRIIFFHDVNSIACYSTVITIVYNINTILRQIFVLLFWSVTWTEAHTKQWILCSDAFLLHAVKFFLICFLVVVVVVVVYWRFQREKSLLCWMWSSVSRKITDCSGQTLWAADPGACSQVSVSNP